MNKAELFEKITQFLKERGVKKVAIFGSYVRGEERPDSDIDIVVEFSERKSLLDIIELEQELSELLGVKVELLTEKSISPYMIERIKNEMKVLYG
ncbi:MAG: nucleotidyltransferase family protein [Thermoplasmata archaeon]